MRIVTIILGLLTFMVFGKYYELSSITFVDGDGIGIYFLWFEINDTVPTADIPKYVTKFLIASIILGISTICTAILAYFNGKKDKISIN